jgi:putative hydrolase of the HAD superfamily
LQKISGVQPEEILYVGDDPGNDVAGAATLGVNSCWVSFGRKFPLKDSTPSFAIAAITELPDLIEEMRKLH